MKKIILCLVAITALYSAEPTHDCNGEKIKKCKTMACAYLEKVKAEVHEISDKELIALMSGKEAFYLIDIRDSKQFERGYIKYYALTNIDRGHLEMEIEHTVANKNDRIVLYCCTGRRSMMSAKALQDMGYTNVQTLQGGMVDWVNNKNPIDNQYGTMIITK